MTRRLLLVHPSRMGGENRGVHVQHVASLQWLLTPAQGWEVVALDPIHPSFPSLSLSSDLVILHTLPSRECEAIIRLRRERGLRTLVEIGDNFLDLGSWLPARHPLRSPLVRQNILYHAALADGVQVYSQGLAELFRHVHREVHVLDPYVPIAKKRAARDTFVVGWGGTTSHAADLERIAPAIVAFCHRHPDALFSFMGDASLHARLFAEIPAEQSRVQPFGEYDQYLAFVRELDVGLAPLGSSGFDAARTDTKFATYAACHVASLLEERDVYRAHSDRAAFFSSPAELEEALDALYVDRNRLSMLADRAHDWAVRERGEERLRAQRLAVYEPLVRGRALPPEPVELLDPVPDVGDALRGDLPDVAALLDVLRARPEFAQTRLALARAYEKLGEHQQAFDVLEEGSFPEIYRDLVAEAQANLARKVRPEAVAQYNDRIASPVTRVRIDHRHDDRRTFLEAMLERQPYDYLALSTRIRELLASDPESGELPLLCLRLCLIAPEMVPSEYRPASLARFLPG